jgi:hypothetical protein
MLSRFGWLGFEELRGISRFGFATSREGVRYSWQ